VPVRSPNTQDLISVGEAKDASVFSFSSPKGTVLKWQSLFALLLCGMTVRMTVEYYETLRETLVWQAKELGMHQDAIPGIRKIQRVLMPFVRLSCYAKSELVAVQKKGGEQHKFELGHLASGQ
jgi:hypothetical protein